MSFTTFKGPRKAMNRIGKVGRRRLRVSAELKREAEDNGHDYCELRAVLRDSGISDTRCFGELENCHSVKCSPRGSDPVLDRETARGCEHHHRIMDADTHAVQLATVRAAIARRG